LSTTNSKSKIMLWGSSLSNPREQDSRRNPWHNEAEYIHDGRERAETVSGDDSSDSREDRVGTWGEADVGRIDTRTAAEDLEVLRNELSVLSRTRSQAARGSISRKSTRQSRDVQRRESVAHTEGSTVGDEEPEDTGAVAAEKEDDFELGEFMKEGYFEKRKDGQSAKKVGVIYKGLTVKGAGSTATFAKTVPDAILGTFGPDLYHLVTRFIPALRLGRHKQTRTLINDFSGMLRPGEMALILGRPGSGCSTFLKAIANNRESYASVEGDVSYGGIPAEQQKKQFRGEVNYNGEDDVHFASLNVWQTLSFALTNKTRKHKKGEIPIILDALLRVFGIQHTKYTFVGDEYIRGVSGGERKRVSIAETLASKSSGTLFISGSYTRR
jgi:ATP-binding cassette subfamily G (WHITE) protein 2 (SNQ2)